MLADLRRLPSVFMLLAPLAGGAARAADPPPTQVDPFWPKPLPNS